MAQAQLPQLYVGMAYQEICAALSDSKATVHWCQRHKLLCDSKLCTSVSRMITTLKKALKGTSPPDHWQLGSQNWNSLPTVIQDVRSFILRDMSSRWNPADLLLGMGAITHPGHKCLSWLNVGQNDVIVQQLRTEMRNISAANDKEDESHESEEEEPAPAPKQCNVEEDDTFDVLFGKETSSVGLPQGSHDVDIVEEEL